MIPVCKQLSTCYLVFCIVFASISTIKAQTIQPIPNPDRPTIFSWTGSGAFSGYAGTPIVLNNTLVLQYNASGTSDLANATLQLAVYKGGDTLQIIPNPDAGNGVYFQSVQIVFDNKLFFIYLDVAGKQRLASFNGISITLYANPDASSSGYIGSPRIFNNALYVAYQNVAGVTQFGRFNGTGISLIPNPDNSTSGFFNNYSTVFNGKIVARYVSASGPKKLATFDGTQWTILANPDLVATRGVQPSFPVLYKNKLYFTYFSATGQLQYLQYDGSNNPTLIANPQNSNVNGGGVTGNFSIVHNDTIFFQYYDVTNVYRLAKFDGSTISLVPNPDATTYGYWYTPVVYGNKLYILYLPVDGSRHLAQYLPGNNSIKVIANPDAGSGYWDQPLVYGEKLYIKYANAQTKFQLASFDGNSIQLISNPAGIYNSGGYDGYAGFPIVWNDVLLMQFVGIPYGYAGNLAKYSAITNNGICPGSNTSFTSDITGATYQWQVDNGNGSFINLSNTAPYSTVTTNNITLTAPPTNLYGYKYRCIVNGNTNSQTFTLKFKSIWTGAYTTSWETPGNWSCGAIPDANTDVYINTGTAKYPVINATQLVRSIRLQSGSTLGIVPNQHLTITGN